MSDYEELIKNLRSVKDTWQTQEEEWMLQAADAIEKLMALTAVDAKPVVRCKDCKCSYEDIGGLTCSHGVCVDSIVAPNFYCANWERREANDE